MSRFAKVNLLEVEDSVAGRVDGLEGRFGRKHLDSRDLGVSLFRYAPNLRSPMAHSHKEQEEAYGKRRTTGMRMGMREPYVEDLASHGGPESCVGDPRGRSEALTGVHAGRLLSLENSIVQGADAVVG